jgi:hypothetical protein
MNDSLYTSAFVGPLYLVFTSNVIKCTMRLAHPSKNPNGWRYFNIEVFSGKQQGIGFLLTVFFRLSV